MEVAMDAHVHISGLEFIVHLAMTIAGVALLTLLARRFSNNVVAQTWLYIFAPGASQHNGN